MWYVVVVGGRWECGTPLALSHLLEARPGTSVSRRLPCKSKSRRKREVSGRARESALFAESGFRIAHECLTADGPRIRCRTGHPFAVSGSPEPSQMIEFVFAASPETIRNGPPEYSPSPSRQPAGPGSLRLPVSRCFCFSTRRKRFSGSRCSAELFGWHEILLSALDGEHIADHFPGNGKRSPVRVTSFQFSGVDDGQLG
jgi:hypothetical protein